MIIVEVSEYNKETFRNFRVSFSSRISLKKARELFENEEVGRILDIGCADGGFLKTFSAHVEKYGIDIIEQKSEGFTFKQCNLEDGIPFEDEFFDKIFCGGVIEHLLDTDFFLDECYRVLKRNGSLVLTTDNLSSLVNLLRWLKKEQPRMVGYNIHNNSWGHVRAYSIIAINRQLEDHNFKIEFLGSIYTGNYNPIIKKLLEKILPLRGGIIVVKARK